MQLDQIGLVNPLLFDFSKSTRQSELVSLINVSTCHWEIHATLHHKLIVRKHIIIKQATKRLS